MPDIDMPKPATLLLSRMVGWSTDVQHGAGPVQFGGLSEETDGDGKRHRVSVTETVDMTLVRGMHVDGRAVIAFWLRRPGGRWEFDFALRGRHLGEYVPRILKVRQLTAYVTAPDAASALKAVAPAPKLALERAA